MLNETNEIAPRRDKNRNEMRQTVTTFFSKNKQYIIPQKASIKSLYNLVLGIRAKLPIFCPRADQISKEALAGTGYTIFSGGYSYQVQPGHRNKALFPQVVITKLLQTTIYNASEMVLWCAASRVEFNYTLLIVAAYCPQLYSQMKVMVKIPRDRYKPAAGPLASPQKIIENLEQIKGDISKKLFSLMNLREKMDSTQKSAEAIKREASHICSRYLGQESIDPEERQLISEMRDAVQHLGDMATAPMPETYFREIYSSITKKDDTDIIIPRVPRFDPKPCTDGVATTTAATSLGRFALDIINKYEKVGLGNIEAQFNFVSKLPPHKESALFVLQKYTTADHFKKLQDLKQENACDCLSLIESDLKKKSHKISKKTLAILLDEYWTVSIKKKVLEPCDGMTDELPIIPLSLVDVSLEDLRHFDPLSRGPSEQKFATIPKLTSKAKAGVTVDVLKNVPPEVITEITSIMKGVLLITESEFMPSFVQLLRKTVAKGEHLVLPSRILKEICINVFTEFYTERINSSPLQRKITSHMSSLTTFILNYQLDFDKGKVITSCFRVAITFFRMIQRYTKMFTVIGQLDNETQGLTVLGTRLRKLANLLEENDRITSVFLNDLDSLASDYYREQTQNAVDEASNLSGQRSFIGSQMQEEEIPGKSEGMVARLTRAGARLIGKKIQSSTQNEKATKQPADDVHFLDYTAEQANASIKYNQVPFIFFVDEISDLIERPYGTTLSMLSAQTKQNRSPQASLRVLLWFLLLPIVAEHKLFELFEYQPVSHSSYYVAFNAYLAIASIITTTLGNLFTTHQSLPAVIETCWSKRSTYYDFLSRLTFIFEKKTTYICEEANKFVARLGEASAMDYIPEKYIKACQCILETARSETIDDALPNWLAFVKAISPRCYIKRHPIENNRQYLGFDAIHSGRRTKCSYNCTKCQSPHEVLFLYSPVPNFNELTNFTAPN